MGDTAVAQTSIEVLAVEEDQSFSTVFQPIVELDSGRVDSYEALTRFGCGTPPDVAFAEAELLGSRAALERSTALAAVDRAADLPADRSLSINLSAETILDRSFLSALTAGPRQMVIELTEHGAVDDYDELGRALRHVRPEAQLAIDDTGAGHSGLAQIRALRPDVVKLDRSLITGVDDDRVGQALVSGMVRFARESGCRIVGEGIETESERVTLLDLGVTHGQGYLLGRPGPPSALVRS